MKGENDNETVLDIAAEMFDANSKWRIDPRTGKFLRHPLIDNWVERLRKAYNRDGEKMVARAVKAMPFRFSGHK